jgi:hypothetical protein
MLSVCTLAGILAACGTTTPDFSESEWREQTKAPDLSLLYAPHQNPDGTFFNPWMGKPTRAGPGFMSRTRMQFPDFPAERYAHRENDYAYLQDTGNSISFAGHASMIIKMDGETVFTDPFFSKLCRMLILAL